MILILSACNNVAENQSVEGLDGITDHSNDKEDQAQILKIDSDLKVKDGWHIVPEGVNAMTISAEVENVETILFWITPTGTGTWGGKNAYWLRHRWE